eukprot:TRINITY_DN9691_c0_g1_i1.p1 TRINITY_DN9691_c0_g1~~TRINITY_DN9691_c0_g1_i1.p1  ORF type:complete len:365 (+),score=36.21 TRINITY_DN9691_c0_g1_i1:257-1351(+)
MLGVGNLNGSDVEFKGPPLIFARGTTPTATTVNGVVLAVFKIELLPLLYIRIGTLDNEQVTWQGESTKYHKGRTPCVAFDGTTVLEVHCSELWNTTFVTSGLLTSDNGKLAIQWSSPARVFAASGSVTDPVIAVSEKSAVVAAVHRHTIVYAVGKVADGRVWWAETRSLPFAVQKGRPTLSIRGEMVALGYQAASGLRLAVGHLDFARGEITFNYHKDFMEGSDLSVTLLSRARVVAAYMQNSAAGQQLWWRTGLVTDSNGVPLESQEESPAGPLSALLPDDTSCCAHSAPCAAQGQPSSSPVFEVPTLVGDETDTACCVCLAARRSLLAYPCGHICLCEGCAQRVGECPLCRTPVEKFIRCFV